MEKFNLLKMQKKGEAKVNVLIGVVVLLILVASLAPVALNGLYNTSAYCGGANCTANPSSVPAWVITTLGIMGAVAFIYIIWNAVKK